TANYYDIRRFQTDSFSFAKLSQRAMVSLISSNVVRGFIRHIRKTICLLSTVVTSKACFDFTIFCDIFWFKASNCFSERLLPIGVYRKGFTANVAGEITSQLGLFRSTFSVASANFTV